MGRVHEYASPVGSDRQAGAAMEAAMVPRRFRIRFSLLRWLTAAAGLGAFLAACKGGSGGSGHHGY